MSFSDVTVALARSGFPRNALKWGFSSIFRRAIFAEKDAYIPTNNSRGQISIAESWLTRDFTENMSLSTISKIWAFQKVFMEGWYGSRLFMFTKSDASFRRRRSLWNYAVFLELPYQVLRLSSVSVSSQSPLARSGFPKSALKLGFSSTVWCAIFGERKAYNSTNNSRSRIATAESWSTRDVTQTMSLLPFCRFEISNKCSWGAPLAKMPKVAHFSCLRNPMLLCLGSVVSGTMPLS